MNLGGVRLANLVNPSYTGKIQGTHDLIPGQAGPDL